MSKQSKEAVYLEQAVRSAQNFAGLFFINDGDIIITKDGQIMGAVGPEVTEQDTALDTMTEFPDDQAAYVSLITVALAN